MPSPFKLLCAIYFMCDFVKSIERAAMNNFRVYRRISWEINKIIIRMWYPTISYIKIIHQNSKAKLIF